MPALALLLVVAQMHTEPAAELRMSAMPIVGLPQVAIGAQPSLELRFVLLDDALVLDASVSGGLAVGALLETGGVATETLSFGLGQAMLGARWRAPVGDAFAVTFGGGPCVIAEPGFDVDVASPTTGFGADVFVLGQWHMTETWRLELRLDVPLAVSPRLYGAVTVGAGVAATFL